jgi:hypothetical protein
MGRAALAVALIALAACGGGGGGGGDDDDDVVVGGDEDPAFGHRLVSLSLDLDANAQVDATQTLSYDADGRFIRMRYVYTGDGTPDRDTVFGTDNQTVTAEYAGAGRVSLWKVLNDDGSGYGARFTYDGDGRATSSDSLEYAPGGAESVAAVTTFTWNGARMVESVMRLPDGTELLRQTLQHDAADRPIELQRAMQPVQRIAYTWNADGTLASESQELNGNAAADQVTTLTYANGRLQSTARTMADLYAGQAGRTYRFSYDAGGQLAATEVDIGSDGSVDARYTATMQAAACRSFDLPIVIPLVTEQGYGSHPQTRWRAFCGT